MEDLPRLRVAFFRTETGREPVRLWLKALSRDERKRIGEEIKTVQYGWPLGMPLVRKMDADLWEVRIRLSNPITRILRKQDTIILLHGYIKKSRKAPDREMYIARARLAQIKGIR